MIPDAASRRPGHARRVLTSVSERADESAGASQTAALLPGAEVAEVA
jgi:hypothetical protein